MPWRAFVVAVGVLLLFGVILVLDEGIVHIDEEERQCVVRYVDHKLLSTRRLPA